MCHTIRFGQSYSDILHFIFFKAHAKILHIHSFQTFNEQYKWNKLVNWFPVWNWQHSIVNNTNSFGAPLHVFFVWHEVGNSHGYDFTAVTQMTAVYMSLFVERTALPHSVRKLLYWLVRSSTLTFQHSGHVMWGKCDSLPFSSWVTDSTSLYD